jgi:hypothetical protein
VHAKLRPPLTPCRLLGMHIVHFPSSAVHVLQLLAYFVIAVRCAFHIVVEGVPPSCPFVLCLCSGAIVASTGDFRVSSLLLEDSGVGVLLSFPLSFLVFCLVSRVFFFFLLVVVRGWHQ